MVRFRKDPALTAPDGAAAMARAAAAIARAEERLPDMFRSPLPPPCAVEPMPPHMAGFGAPPYYSPPARDGSRPGAYLFNDVQPGQAEAGRWRPRPSTKGCPDTTRSSPGYSSCRTCLCC